MSLEVVTSTMAEQIEACRQWLRIYAVRTPRIDRCWHSYNYKHRVEGWLERLGKRIYIAEASLVRAAQLEGFTVRFWKDGRTAYFNFVMVHDKDLPVRR